MLFMFQNMTFLKMTKSHRTKVDHIYKKLEKSLNLSKNSNELSLPKHLYSVQNTDEDD